MNTISILQNQSASLINEIELLREKINYLENSIKLDRFKNLNKTITISIKGQKKMVPLNNIIMIKADSNYSTIYFEGNKSVLTSKTLKHWQDILDHSIFARVHKSFLINRDKIHIQKGSYVELEEGLIVRLSRRKKQHLKG